MSDILRWSKEFDDDDNTMWVAFLSGEEEHFEYRIKQRLQANRHEWIEASSPEVMPDEDEPRTWPDADAAKAQLEKDCADMVKSLSA